MNLELKEILIKTEEEDDIYKQFYIDNNNVINPYEIVEKIKGSL